MRSAWIDGRSVLLLSLVAGVAACSDSEPAGVLLTDTTNLAVRTPSSDRCTPGNGGITLPPDFCAIVVADLTVGGEPARARHIAVTPAGEVFVAINSPRNNNPAFGIVGLRDK